MPSERERLEGVRALVAKFRLADATTLALAIQDYADARAKDAVHKDRGNNTAGPWEVKAWETLKAHGWEQCKCGVLVPDCVTHRSFAGMDQCLDVETAYWVHAYADAARRPGDDAAGDETT
jgi:hypothetical protein